MCPACLMSAALIYGGATTAGGATALFVQRVRARKRMRAPESLPGPAVRRDDREPESHGG
ncbi:MAG: hypothetical protein WD793_13980 [Steroidobacteraceae bacterium]